MPSHFQAKQPTIHHAPRNNSKVAPYLPECQAATQPSGNLSAGMAGYLCTGITGSLCAGIFSIGIAKKEGLKLSRTYARERKELLLKLRFRSHPKRRREARKAEKRLLTIAGRILRDLERKLGAAGELWVYAHNLELFGRVLSQKRKDKNKVYSLHEPSVSCIAKGKEHKPYEFGSKVSIAATRTRGIIVGALAFEGNPYDGNTLAPTLDQTEKLTGKRPKDATADRGYRGRKKLGSTAVHIPTPPPAGQTKAQAKAVRKRFRRRTAIEPRISHLKQDYRMGRNFLKGVKGDTFNLLMAATAWNFRLWIIAFSAPFLALRRAQLILMAAIGAGILRMRAVEAKEGFRWRVIKSELCTIFGKGTGQVEVLKPSF